MSDNLNLNESPSQCQQKLKESIYEGNAFRALLTDLSNAFNCIDHAILIGKLFAFELMYSYLVNQTQRLKIKKKKKIIY